MRLLRLVDAFVDRAGLRPAIAALAVIAVGYATGILGQIWSFQPWLQAAIFAGFVVLAVWALGRLLHLVLRPSAQEVQAEILALWKQGDGFVHSGAFGSPHWETWRVAVFRVYARWANANDSAWLTTEFASSEYGTKAAMDGLRKLADTLDTDARTIQRAK